MMLQFCNVDPFYLSGVLNRKAQSSWFELLGFQYIQKEIYEGSKHGIVFFTAQTSEAQCHEH